MRQVLQPLQPPYPAETEAVLDRYPKGANNELIALFRVFANSLRFLARTGPANLLDSKSPLSIREREIAILRITARLGCEYEWGVHVAVFSRAAGLSREEVDATHLGPPSAGCWSETESLLVRCIDEICDGAMIEQATLPQFQETWDLDQQLEILALCGHYHLISFVAKTVGLQNEPETPGFQPEQS